MKIQLWRFIDTGSLRGAQNMAIDESLLCSFDPKLSVPILRIYGWNTPSLSLGRFQEAKEVLDLERCYADSIPIVRRVSGGGTIYHADELTYSIVCSPEHIPSVTSVKESFRVLTGFLIDFYKALGLDASYALDTVSDAERLGTRTAFCFAGKESFDILINGKKIGGNAQRRLKNVIFQHGSIPLVNQAMTGLQYMNDRSPEYGQGTVSLFESGVSLDMSILKCKLVESFYRSMGVETSESCMSKAEYRMSEELLLNKYTTECWNLRGEVK